MRYEERHKNGGELTKGLADEPAQATEGIVANIRRRTQQYHSNRNLFHLSSVIFLEKIFYAFSDFSILSTFFFAVKTTYNILRIRNILFE